MVGGEGGIKWTDGKWKIGEVHLPQGASRTDLKTRALKTMAEENKSAWLKFSGGRPLFCVTGTDKAPEAMTFSCISGSRSAELSGGVFVPLFIEGVVALEYASRNYGQYECRTLPPSSTDNLAIFLRGFELSAPLLERKYRSLLRSSSRIFNSRKPSSLTKSITSSTELDPGLLNENLASGNTSSQSDRVDNIMERSANVSIQ